GFELRVCTPCWISVDRRMKSDIGRGPYCTSGLVDVEKRTAEEEQRAEHEVGEKDRRALAVVALRVEERAQRVRGDSHDDHERGEGTERVHVVGWPEAAPANERAGEAEPLDHRRRNGEADERQPCERG